MVNFAIGEALRMGKFSIRRLHKAQFKLETDRLKVSNRPREFVNLSLEDIKGRLSGKFWLENSR